MKINRILSVGCSNTIGVNLEEETDIFDYLKKVKDYTFQGQRVQKYREENKDIISEKKKLLFAFAKD